MLRFRTRLRATATSFSPASLFTAGEQGFIYDPSDFSTLYQDPAGTTPVTAVGQTVGLVLDKSKGLVLGPELVTNGTFNANLSDWTVLSGNVSVWSDGRAFVGGGGNITGIYQDFPTVSGRTYIVSAQIQYVSGPGARLRVIDGGSFTNPQDSNVVTSGTATAIIFARATGSTMRLLLRSTDTITDTTLRAYYDNISVRELPGNHATQATAVSRPLLQQDASGRYYLLFDGTDDFLVTPTITPGTDKVQVFAGVRKLSDAVAGIVVETSPSATANNGGLYIAAPNSNAPTYGFASRGTSLGSAVSAGFSSPTTNVLTGIGDIAADVSILRVNGAQVASAATDQGTSNYLAYPMYIGRRGGTSLPLNGRIYSLITRFGSNLDATTIAQAEAYVNSKTGAY